MQRYLLILAISAALVASCGAPEGTSGTYTGAYGSGSDAIPGNLEGSDASGGDGSSASGNDTAGGSATGTVNATLACEELKCAAEVAACKADAKCGAAFACQAACATSACTLTCAQMTGPLATALNNCGNAAGCTGSKPVSVCGNGTCEAGETEANCATDCSTAPQPVACTPYTAVQAIFKNNCNGCHGHQFGTSCAQASNYQAIAQWVGGGAMPPTGPLSAADKALVAAWAKSGGKCTAADCGSSTTTPVCGNGSCEAGETASNCPKDCAATSTCGNGTCDPGETAASCAKDCATGPGPSTGNVCDGLCGKQAPSGCYCDDQCAQYGDCCFADGSMPTQNNPNTACTGSTCAACNGGGGGGTPAAACGNGKCEAGETAASCAKDCSTGPGPSTGNVCDGLCGKQAPSGCYCDDQCAQYGDCCFADGSMPTKNNPNTACTGSTCAACNGGGGGGTPAPVCGNGTCETGETAASCPSDCGGGGTKTCTTYADVQAIFKNNCNGCHGHKFGNGCSSASSYSMINSWVQAGQMPPKGGLSAADKAKIAAWAAAKNACTTAQCP